MKTIIDIGILLAGYVGGFFMGSYLLKWILHFIDPELHLVISKKIDFRDVGAWIGVCEHFLVITFILADEFTAIGLIFAAKEIVRSEKIRERPSYYLLGTLLSISFAVLFGMMIKLLL